MKISRATFAGSSTTVGQKPGLSLPEIAFIGRSNVGKSSLINCLCGNSHLAMTSSTPGKTKVVNHFNVDDKWYLVDLPGYGYAKLPQKERRKIEDVIRNYLNFSKELRLLFVLVDSRHDLVGTDADFIREMGTSDIPFAVIFTKADKKGPRATAAQVEKCLGSIEAVLGHRPDSIVSSAASGAGKDGILQYIDQILNS